MKTPHKKVLIALFVLVLNIACSSNDNGNGPMTDDDFSQTDDDPTPTDDDPGNGEDYQMADVQVLLPDNGDVDLANAKLVSLGADSDVDGNGMGQLPLNSGTVESAYLLDAENHVLLAGLISEDRKELSIETTAELMVYYALGYHLLPESAKSAFLKGIGQVPGFPNFVGDIQTLFEGNPLIYSEGGYESALQDFLDQITAKHPVGSENRIFHNEENTKSGVTLSSVDSTRIKLQNSLPRRSRVVIYKKSYSNRNGDPFEIPNYTSSTIANFKLESGGSNTIQELEVGNSLQQINAQQASIDNAIETDPILLPVDSSTELVAEYEVVIIGSGQRNTEARDMTAEELDIYAQINKETYIIDYFLPTLLDVGGNKSLLPPFGSDKENALYNAVLPVLEQYPDVIDEVVGNEFKAATEIFLPALYEDIRLSNALRGILTDVYAILSGNGDFPNRFIKTQELIETGYDRTKFILATIDRNIKATNYYSNFSGLRTTAFNFESWEVKSIDAVVELQQDRVELCLGQATELRVTALTDYDPEVEEFEFHWSTSNEFKGRVQDIGGNSGNFGASIVTTNNYVSYISAALESELGGGNNEETVTVELYFRNKTTDELTKAGQDTMIVNNKKGCESFTVSFQRQPNFRETSSSSLLCSGGPEYQAFSPVPFVADFAKVDGASGYKAVITRSNGVVNQEIELDEDQLEDIGGGMLRYHTAVGSIVIYNTCDEAEAEAYAKELVDNINVVPTTVEITAIFN